jgi:cyclase
MVGELVQTYGSQSIVASVDCKFATLTYEIYSNNGSRKLDYVLEDYLKFLQDLGVGEIYLNSIDRDGTGFGYDLKLLNRILDNIQTPLIVAGGAGNELHLLECLKIDNVSGVATANLFNFLGDGLPKARKAILDSNCNIAKWNY